MLTRFYVKIKNMTRFLKFALETSKQAGNVLYKSFRKGDPVKRGTSKEVKSVYDIISDEIIKKAIEKNFPTHSYVTEETGWVKKDKKYLWVIDPMDGTSNLENHNPFFSVSIALWVDGKPALGVIEAPALGERYYAISGKGAYRIDLLRHKKVKAKVSENKNISKSFFVFCEGGEKKKERTKKIFDSMYPKMKEFRKLGSAALELAWVGTGRAEGYVTTGINFWDIGAGLIFVKEAGGKILKFNGKQYDLSEFEPLGKYDLAATNGKIKMGKL